jgi:hypothetical protein
MRLGQLKRQSQVFFAGSLLAGVAGAIVLRIASRFRDDE